MQTCECGQPVYIKKTGECRRCYMKRWRSENPDRLTTYRQRHSGPGTPSYERSKVRARARYAERAAAIAEAARDGRPFEIVLLEKTDQAFIARERHLQRRREWNAKNAERRAEYRRSYADPAKAERNRRAAERREAETGQRSAPYRLTPEQKARKKARMAQWRADNRERINAQNAERMRAARRATRDQSVTK